MFAVMAFVTLVVNAAPPRDVAPGSVHAAMSKVKAMADETKAAAPVSKAKPKQIATDNKVSAAVDSKPVEALKLKVAKVSEASVVATPAVAEAKKPVAESLKPVVVPAAKPEPASVVEKPAADSFPTDWMKSSNILKYNIDSDPMTAKIDTAAVDAEQARAFNLKHVELIAQKKHQRTAMEFLYVDDSEQSPSNDHCPACGDLVCPHGFTAQPLKNHCCPYCVNPSVSTEVVKDPAWYAAQADPVMKKYR